MYGFDNYIASRGYRFLWKSKGLFADYSCVPYWEIYFFSNYEISSRWKSKQLSGLKSRGKKHPRESSLKEIHNGNRVKRTPEYTKTDFWSDLFSNECCIILDRSEGWSKVWLSTGRKCLQSLRHQQGKNSGIIGGGGFIFEYQMSELLFIR